MNKATTLKSQVKSKRGYVVTRVLFLIQRKTTYVFSFVFFCFFFFFLFISSFKATWLDVIRLYLFLWKFSFCFLPVQQRS